MQYIDETLKKSNRLHTNSAILFALTFCAFFSELPVEHYTSKSKVIMRLYQYVLREFWQPKLALSHYLNIVRIEGLMYCN